MSDGTGQRTSALLRRRVCQKGFIPSAQLKKWNSYAYQEQ